MSKFDELREKYTSFVYSNFDIQYEENCCKVAYHFSVEGLTDFVSKWEFPVWRQGINQEIMNRLVFSLGMAETISYWKCACPKTLEVRCGKMSEEQLAWWNKLYYNGLGEFMYRNGIETTMEELVTIECERTAIEPLHDKGEYSGCLVSVGGGKDSAVSLELLKDEKITTYSINPNSTTENVIAVCDYKVGNYKAKRVLDKKIIELNSEGYLNGHIPFSAVVAFSSMISAYLSGNKYIVLSNETSANESTVKDSFVNHQYSKSYEFEKDFDWYIDSIVDFDIHYFSFLRPLAEIQIAWLFSKCTKYHKVFRSCNVGSKTGIWCCDCPKCLFVYIIMSPFFEQEELIHIFGENLLEKESLDKDFRELTGIAENKPFECVGTRREVLVALNTFMDKGGRSLLTDRYSEFIRNNYEKIDVLLGSFVNENNVPKHFKNILEGYLKQ